VAAKVTIALQTLLSVLTVMFAGQLRRGGVWTVSVAALEVSELHVLLTTTS
jgi:hypothetical protein